MSVSVDELVNVLQGGTSNVGYVNTSGANAQAVLLSKPCTIVRVWSNLPVSFVDANSTPTYSPTMFTTPGNSVAGVSGVVEVNWPMLNGVVALFPDNNTQVAFSYA